MPWLAVWLLSMGLVLLVVMVLSSARIPGLHQLEVSSADYRTVLLSDRTSREHADVAVVAISDRTLEAFAVKSPIDRNFLASLIRAIDAAGPRAIGLDVYFLRRTEDAKDGALLSALRSSRAPIVLGALDERGRMTPEQRTFQSEFIAQSGRPAGFLALQFDRDGVSRRIAEPAVGSQFPHGFSLLLARTMRPEVRPQSTRIAWLQKVDGGGLLTRVVNWDGTSPFPRLDAEDLLGPQGLEHAAQLKGRIVLIGADFAYVDRHRTPLTVWSGEDTPGVMVHAQIVAQLVDGRSADDLTPERSQFVLVALACFGGFLGWRFREREFDFLGWSIAAFALTITDALVFSNLRLILPFMVSMLTWFAAVTVGHNLGLLYDWEIRRSLMVADATPPRDELSG